MFNYFCYLHLDPGPKDPVLFAAQDLNPVSTEADP